VAGRRAVIVAKDEKLVEGCMSEAVRYYPYLPFGSLLPHLAAIIHHGGMGTSAQAIAAALPQLVLPSKWDRPDNAERLKQLKVAQYLTPRLWDAGTVADALLRLLSSADTKQHCLALARRMSPGVAIEKACHVIELFVKAQVVNLLDQRASAGSLAAT
jgi:UDP:flavonoid glycosyltransferase YjiC (YdhE family)